MLTTPSIINTTNTSKLYITNINGINEIEQKLASGMWGDIWSLIKNAMEGIVGLKLYPLDFSKVFPSPLMAQTNVLSIGGASDYVENRVYELPDNRLPYQIPSYTSRLMLRMVRGYHIERKFNSFLDYAPYTRLKLYLPYIDTIELNVSEVMDKYLWVTYAIDILTGGLTAFIEVTDSSTYQDPKLVIQASSVIGIDIPLGQTNAREVQLKNILNGIQLAGSLASIGIGAVSGNELATGIGVIGTLKSASVGTIEANQQHISKGKASGDFTSFYAPQDVILIRQTLKTRPIDYASVKGRPCGKYIQLSTLEGKGYTKVQAIHLENFNSATSSELSEIEDYLKSGVIL